MMPSRGSIGMQVRLWAMLAIAISLAGCPTPVEKWKAGFDDILADITRVAHEPQEIQDYRSFYTLCEELENWCTDSEYARDLLKDLLMTSGNMPVRAAAGETLGRIGTLKEINALLTGLHDDSGFVRERVARALKLITHEDFGQDRDSWLKWWQKEEKKYDN